jgi:hypothetical protein
VHPVGRFFSGFSPGKNFGAGKVKQISDLEMAENGRVFALTLAVKLSTLEQNSIVEES